MHVAGDRARVFELGGQLELNMKPWQAPFESGSRADGRTCLSPRPHARNPLGHVACSGQEDGHVVDAAAGVFHQLGRQGPRHYDSIAQIRCPP